RMRQKRVVLMLAMAVSLAWATAAGAHLIKEDEGDDVAPTGRGFGERRDHNDPRGAPPKATGKSAGIDHHGGPPITAGPNVYIIWYGTWLPGTQGIIVDMLDSIGGSGWFNIASTYFDAHNIPVTNNVALMNQYYDNYSKGKSLSDASIKSIVQAQNPTD